jgi:hypothetical protein
VWFQPVPKKNQNMENILPAKKYIEIGKNLGNRISILI